MHPAPSVIIFTSLSGLGFGLLFFLGLGLPDVRGWVAFVFYALGFGLAVIGLLASTFHLKNPKNAIKAFSQWRTSWLSREGVVSVAALLVMGLYAGLHIFFDLRIALLGLLGSLLCLGTVLCTAMIYKQLKTVPRWYQPLTVPLFLAFALTGGALMAGQTKLAIAGFVLLGLLQLAYWVFGDRAFGAAGSTIGTATGLSDLGQIRLLESPHSGKNYLLTEMVHIVARKHAIKLRVIAFVLGVVLPLLLLVLLPAGHLGAALAILSHVVGLLVSRWLFFAEAEHVVGLYYDRR